MWQIGALRSSSPESDSVNQPERRFLTIAEQPDRAARGDSRPPTSIPPVLLHQATRRIPLVCLTIAAGFGLGWLGTTTFAGDLPAEFSDFFQWGPPTIVIVTSLALFAVARRNWLAPNTLVNLGLVYEVLVSHALALTQYWGAFQGMLPEEINRDRIGWGVVALFMIVYTALVPTVPRRAVLALIASAASVPIVYLVSVSIGEAPALPAGQFLLAFVFPYVFAVLLAYFPARIIYRLGEDVRRAREMGSYRLERLLGKGGMGEVWQASHRMLARPAAVKLIRSDAPGLDAARLAGALVRFEREAQVTASLQSAHTVELYDFGTADDGSLYYVMELLEGVDLDQVVKKWGPLPPERVIYILRQVCASLGEAHHRGLVHRDIKPANIFLCQRAFEYDFVKVLDFGLVKGYSSIDPLEHPSLSRVGFVVGTPAYLAPEIVLGEEPDGRADLYALGCVAYWLLTGQVVFEEKSVPALLVAHSQKEPVRPSTRSGRAMPDGLDDLVLDCLAKEPDDRVPSADVLAHRLDEIALVEPWSREDARSWWASVTTPRAPLPAP